MVEAFGFRLLHVFAGFGGGYPLCQPSLPRCARPQKLSAVRGAGNSGQVPQWKYWSRGAVEQSQGTRGRPPGARMPCGWHCGAELACTEMRGHFTHCSKRPEQRHSMTRARCGCCSAEYEFSAYAPTRLCPRCRSGGCWQCYSGGNVLNSNRKMGGRPPGPRMPCGWGCGAQLTARLMRGHFTDCSNRPGEFGHKAPGDPKRA